MATPRLTVVQRNAAREVDERYLSHFGLTELPFATTPSPLFAFQTESMLRGLGNIRNVATYRSGFGIVSGQVGTGKTTTMRLVESDLATRGHTVLAFSAIPGNTRQTEGSIAQDIANELRLPKVAGNSTDGYLNAIHEYANALDEQDVTMVVLIDEAQEIKPTTIRLVLRLLAMQTARNQLIQVILFGQSPEIMTAVKANRALHSRLSAHAELEPFAPDEVGEMIGHRLKIAGARTHSVFADEAIQKIAQTSRGIPRLVCLIANAACIYAYQDQENAVQERHVARAAHELQHEV